MAVTHLSVALVQELLDVGEERLQLWVMFLGPAALLRGAHLGPHLCGGTNAALEQTVLVGHGYLRFGCAVPSPGT